MGGENCHRSLINRRIRLANLDRYPGPITKYRNRNEIMTNRVTKEKRHANFAADSKLRKLKIDKTKPAIDIGNIDNPSNADSPANMTPLSP